MSLKNEDFVPLSIVKVEKDTPTQLLCRVEDGDKYLFAKRLIEYAVVGGEAVPVKGLEGKENIEIVVPVWLVKSKGLDVLLEEGEDEEDVPAVDTVWNDDFTY
jgi:hypothetical protein